MVPGARSSPHSEGRAPPSEGPGQPTSVPVDEAPLLLSQAEEGKCQDTRGPEKEELL